jgi:hypothetical protein
MHREAGHREAGHREAERADGVDTRVDLTADAVPRGMVGTIPVMTTGAGSQGNRVN